MFASGFIDSSTTAGIDVWYRNDARLGLWVPSSMKERHRGECQWTGSARRSAVARCRRRNDRDGDLQVAGASRRE
jgi:hypothetical protein